MLEIGTSGLMSGERKRVAQSFGWIPRLSSTLPHFRTLVRMPRALITSLHRGMPGPYTVPAR